jgi:hypothetical protein
MKETKNNRKNGRVWKTYIHTQTKFDKSVPLASQESCWEQVNPS